MKLRTAGVFMAAYGPTSKYTPDTVPSPYLVRVDATCPVRANSLLSSLKVNRPVTSEISQGRTVL